MQKQQIVVTVVVAILATFFFLWRFMSAPLVTVTNFEECAALGNPIMESYPRQCRYIDKTFVEEVFETFTQNNGPVTYSIDIPFGWYSYESGPSVIFTQDSDLKIPPNSDGWAIGPNFYISTGSITDIEGVTNYDQWFEKNGMTVKSDLFIEKYPVTVNGLEMFRVRNHASGVAAEVVSYVYFADVQHVVTMTQFPYNPESNITKVFENAVKTFRVPVRQGGGGV